MAQLKQEGETKQVERQEKCHKRNKRGKGYKFNIWEYVTSEKRKKKWDNLKEWHK